MMAESVFEMHRREAPRVAVESFCSEYAADRERHGMIIELSCEGLRLQRPMRGCLPRQIQLEFELPEVDEVVWAHGEVCFDQLWQVPVGDEPAPNGLLRTSGVRLIGMAPRHRRMIREFVTSKWRETKPIVDDDDFMFASCYRRG